MYHSITATEDILGPYLDAGLIIPNSIGARLLFRI